MQARLAADAYEFRFTDPSLLIELDDGTWRATAIAGDHLDIEPLLTWAVPQERQGQYLLVSSPRIERPITDRQIAATQALKQLGYLSRDFNVPFLFRADLSEAEMAGVLGALIGSILIMVVTMCLVVPVGIAAAIYLEEFCAAYLADASDPDQYQQPRGGAFYRFRIAWGGNLYKWRRNRYPVY